MELKKGMYARTKTKGIVKILDVGCILGMTQYLINDNGDYVIDNYIIKSSYNIIDLIEVGDYVNGHKVTSIEENGLLGFGNNDWYMHNEDIKSIVTKEQFSQIEYRLGE